MQEIQEFKAAAAEFTEAAKRLGSVSSTSGVHIHGSGLLAVVVALIGFCGIVVAVAAVLVVAAWRSADMAQIGPIKADIDQATARVENHERRLLKLENPPQ